MIGLRVNFWVSALAGLACKVVAWGVFRVAWDVSRVVWDVPRVVWDVSRVVWDVSRVVWGVPLVVCGSRVVADVPACLFVAMIVVYRGLAAVGVR